MLNTKENILSLVHQGQFIEARNMCLEMLKIDGSNAELIFLLGNIHNRSGLYSEAEQCFMQVLSVRPDLPSAHYNLGCARRNLGRLAEAVESLKKATQLNPDFYEAWDTLGMVCAQLNLTLDSVRYLKRSLEIKPDYQSAYENLGKAYITAVSQWHFPMMNDTVRNSAYEDAIKKITTPDAVVLDIGTGSGLLSMMAVRAGASHVYTCEMNTLVADKAKAIIAANGMKDKITVLSMNSNQIKMGQDMPEKADILVSEILDVGLLAEGVLSTVQFAKNNLLKEGALITPEEADVFVTPLDSTILREEFYIDSASGFDLSLFNEFASREYSQVRIDHFDHKLLSEPAKAFTIKLDGTTVLPEKKEIDMPVKTTGTCHAVAMWFKVKLYDGIIIDTGPGDNGCWKQAVMPLEKPIEVQAGQKLAVSVEHNCNRILISDVKLSD